MDVTEAVDHAPRSRGLVLGAAVVVAVVMVALVVVLATRDPAQDRVDESPLVGHVAPPLMGEVVAPEATAGSEFDLDRLRGQWVVVNFFATWCVPCVTEHPELIEFSERHAATGDASVASVVFDADENVEDIADFFADNGGDWPVLLNRDGRAPVDFGVVKVPESYLVDPGGVVVAKFNGGVTQADLDDTIADFEDAG
jgi:cytochrome c biogenesis protein CcmG/thiol:disulfide interchange protein DsbE